MPGYMSRLLGLRPQWLGNLDVTGQELLQASTPESPLAHA